MKKNDELIDELIIELRACKTDAQRWAWIMKNKENKDFSVRLDNSGNICVMTPDAGSDVVVIELEEKYNDYGENLYLGITSILTGIGVKWEYFEFKHK